MNKIYIGICLLCFVLGFLISTKFFSPEITTTTEIKSDTIYVSKTNTIHDTIKVKGKIDTLNINNSKIPLVSMDTVLSSNDTDLTIDLKLKVDYFFPPINEFKLNSDLKYTVRSKTITDSILVTKVIKPKWYETWQAGLVYGVVGTSLIYTLTRR